MKNFLSTIRLEASLLKRNILSKFGIYSPTMQNHFLLEELLPADKFQRLQNLVLRNKQVFFRKDSFFRQGTALDAFDLQTSPLTSLIDELVNEHLLERIRKSTNMPNLVYAPQGDGNQISLLYYGDDGDGIGWHVDGNIYLGQRWAGIFTLHEQTNESTSKLEIKPHGKTTVFTKESVFNGLILFQGDQIRHRVRSMQKGEERLVINLLFTTDPTHTKNPLLKGYQALVNYFFYGKLQTSFKKNLHQQEKKND